MIEIYRQLHMDLGPDFKDLVPTPIVGESLWNKFSTYRDFILNSDVYKYWPNDGYVDIHGKKKGFVAVALNAGPNQDLERILIVKLARNEMLSGNQILLEKRLDVVDPGYAIWLVNIKKGGSFEEVHQPQDDHSKGFIAFGLAEMSTGDLADIRIRALGESDALALLSK
jgi:hypothetical protein